MTVVQQIDEPIDTRRYWIGVSLFVLLLLLLSALVAWRGGTPSVRALSLTPAADSTSSVQPVIRVRFARAVEKGSVSEAIQIAPEVPFSISWNEEELRILPERPLQADQRYQVTIGPDLIDTSGNPLSGQLQWTFTTRQPRVAYITSTGELWLTPLDGETPTRLTAPGQAVQTVTTTRDGDTLVYTASENESTTSLWRLDLATSGLSQLTRERDTIFNAPQFSPTGDLLVVESRQVVDVGGSPTLAAPDIELRRPTDGSPAGPIYGTDDETAHSARWSPTGTQIAFIESTLNEVALFNFTTDLLTFPADSASFSQQVWDPAGRAITYSRFLFSDGNARQAAVVRDLQMGTEIPLLGDEGDTTAPAWHPDGALIALVRLSPMDESSTAGIWVTDPAGQEARPLLSEPRIIYTEPQWSPDGEWLLFGRIDPTSPNGAQSLWIMRPDGSEARELVPQGSKALWVP